MAEIAHAPKFALEDRVRISVAPGYELFARVKEIFGPFGPNQLHSYRVSMEAAMEEPRYATFSEDFLEKAPRKKQASRRK